MRDVAQGVVFSRGQQEGSEISTPERSPGMGTTVDRARSGPVPPITERQVQILRLVARGMSNRAIGQTLSISQYTVRNHLRRAMRALGVNDRTSAIVEGMKLGLVELPETLDGPAALTPIPIQPDEAT